MSVNWPPKDVDAVLDYRFDIPLDTGDSVATATLSVLSGDVVIDSQSVVDGGIVAWLSGGTAGETAVFRAEWLTVGGRSNDEAILLSVTDNEASASLAVELKMRFPEFLAVPDATVEYWLNDATRVVVSTEWDERNGPLAQMLVAAHNMAMGGLGGSGGLDLPAGVTAMRSGGLSLSFDADTARNQAAGGWAATKYGAQYLALLRLHRGGARTTTLGSAPACGWYRDSLLSGYGG